MPTRSIFQPFLYKQAFTITAYLMVHAEYSETQCRALFFPSNGPHSAQLHFYLRLFSTNAVSKPRLLKNLTKTACLHNSTLKKCLFPHGGKKPWGYREKSPCHFLCPMQERSGQQELAIAKALAIGGVCDVSHFRMDSTMCATPPSFFLFFLSCQMNACTLGHRTEEVIHQKWWKRMHDSDFFLCTPWFICLSFIWATDRGFGEQCEISRVSTRHNKKQDHATKMLRQTECSAVCAVQPRPPGPCVDFASQ